MTTILTTTRPIPGRGFLAATLAAAAIGLGTLMTLSAPAAHADSKSDCENQGGTYTEGTVTDVLGTHKVGTCCVKNVATGETKCTQTVLSNAQSNPTQPPRRPVAPIGPGKLPVNSSAGGNLSGGHSPSAGSPGTLQ